MKTTSWFFLLLAALPIRGVAVTAPVPATLDAYVALQRDPILVAYVQPYRLYQGRTAEMTPSGAMIVNAQFERGFSKAHFVEDQRRGVDFLIAPGLVLNDQTAIAKGITALDYGFKLEEPDGTFPGNPDVFHSAEFFLEAAVQAALIMRKTDSVGFAGKLAEWKPKLRALTQWIMDPVNADSPKARADLKLFTHRYYSHAAALGQAAELFDLPDAARAAEKTAELGVAAQTAEGVNPERGGFDAGYQAAGLQFAERYYFFCHNPALRDCLAKMIERGTDVLAKRLDASGQIDTQTSTRMGKEKTRDGATKSFNYAVLVNVLVQASAITGREDFRALGEQVGQRQVLPELRSIK